MTYRAGGRFFRTAVPALALSAIAALAIAGCSTDTADENVPIAAGRTGGPIDTGTFPNLNVPRQAAANQLTQEEKDAKLASLRAAQARQSAGGGAEISDAERKKLKLTKDDQEDTLKVIENN